MASSCRRSSHTLVCTIAIVALSLTVRVQMAACACTPGYAEAFDLASGQQAKGYSVE